MGKGKGKRRDILEYEGNVHSFVSIYSFLIQVTNSLNMLLQNATQLETNSVSVERIVEYSNLPFEVSLPFTRDFFPKQ